MTKQSHDGGWRPTMEAAPTSAAGFTPAPMVAVPAPTPFSTGPQLPSYDVLDALAGAPAAAERLRQLRQRRDDAHRLCVEFATVHQMSMEKTAAQNELTRLTGPPQTGGFGLKSENNSVRQAQKRLDVAIADFERTKQLQEVRAAAWQRAGAALASCEDWLRHGKPSGVLLQDYDGEPPKLNKNETVIDAIERLRRRGRELRADLHRIASAPYPSKYAKALLREAIEALAQRGTPDVSALIEHGDRGSVIWPTQRVRLDVVGGTERALTFHEEVDVVGLFAAILKPAMISFLDTLVDAEKDDPASLSPEARELAASEVQNDLIAAEHDLAAFVFQAQAQNLPIEHGEISPLALLGLQLVSAPRADGSPPTSWMHAYDIVPPGGGRRR